VNALAEASTPKARALLARLARDRNAEVAAAAARAMSRLQAGERRTGEQRTVGA
jgi:hypothetical protein